MEYYLARKEWITDTCNNMYESQKHYAKWKKSVSKVTCCIISYIFMTFCKTNYRGVPWWPRILGFHCRGPGSIPGQGTEIPQAARHSQKRKKQTTRMKTENRSVVVRGEVGGKGWLKIGSMMEFCKVMELFCVLTVIVITHFYAYIKTRKTVH